MRTAGLAAIALVAILWAPGLQAGPQDARYMVGIGDVLQLHVWQAPSLDRQLTVGTDGMVLIPMAGAVRAAGISIGELEGKIVRRLADFNRSVTEASLTVAEFHSRSIYVLGRVMSPGKYSYAEPIHLFDLVREAGGFTEDALRTRVKVVHREGGQERIQYANVESALETGHLDALPLVRAGDTVIVPKRSAERAVRDGVQIIGEVRSPAIYALEDVDDLVGLLLVAGGPSERANLRQVRLVRNATGGGTLAREFNVESFLNQGVTTENPRCMPGDTIYVPRRRGGVARGLRIVPLVLGSVATSLGIYFTLTR